MTPKSDDFVIAFPLGGLCPLRCKGLGEFLGFTEFIGYGSMSPFHAIKSRFDKEGPPGICFHRLRTLESASSLHCGGEINRKFMA